MEKLIKSILGDLYKLDPKLKKSEKDLVPLLEKLVKAKPHIKLDEGFVKNLRHQLIAHADELMREPKPSEAHRIINEDRAKEGWFARILAPLMGGTVALAALVIGLMVWKGSPVTPQPTFVPPTPTLMRVQTPNVTDGDQGMPLPPAEKKDVVPALDETASEPPSAEPKRIMKTEPLRTPPVPTAAEPGEEPVSAPMMLTTQPSEDKAGEAATPAPRAALKSTDMATAGVSNVGVDPIAYTQAALKRAQSGERKITASSAQVGFRSPQELMGLNFDNLPEGFVEMIDVLPSGYRAFADWASGVPEYYIYFKKTYQWYGPF